MISYEERLKFSIQIANGVKDLMYPLRGEPLLHANIKSTNLMID